MTLADFQYVLETGTLNRAQLIGFLVALFYTRDSVLRGPRTAGKAYDLLIIHTGSEEKANYIFHRALQKYSAICGLP